MDDFSGKKRIPIIVKLKLDNNAVCNRVLKIRAYVETYQEEQERYKLELGLERKLELEPGRMPELGLELK